MSSIENWKDWLKSRITPSGDAEWNGSGEPVKVFTSSEGEYRLATQGAGLIDQSSRGRICLLGEDRVRFLNGQVTNQLESLPTGNGVVAGLVNAKGKLEADLHIYILQDEILIDFESNLTEKVVARLDKYIIADDVEIVDVSPDYGALTVIGPKAREVLLSHPDIQSLPDTELGTLTLSTESGSEWVLIRRSRWGLEAYDVLAPWEEFLRLAQFFSDTATATNQNQSAWIGSVVQEQIRIESGCPKYGVDMDESNLAPETGLEKLAISYRKGCYIGQEVIARIRTYGQVAKSLRGFWLPEEMETPPQPGTELFHNGRKVGYLTSVLKSPALNRWIALGYARKECNSCGSILRVGDAESGIEARVVSMPFEPVQDRGAVA